MWYSQFVIFILMIIPLLAIMLLKIKRKNNRYVIIFSSILIASILLELLSLYPYTNYAMLDFEIYFFKNEDSQDLQSFQFLYNMIGYVYYSS